MAAIQWTNRRGQTFSEEEAREASDFWEILSNFGLDDGRAFDMFSREPLSVAKRLALVEMSPLDGAAVMLLNEPDARVRAVIQARLEEERVRSNGGIIVS